MTQGKICRIDDGSNFPADATLVFGHFNLVHPGHRRFLAYAKSLEAPLIVAIVGDNRLAPSERDHYYPEEERAEGVAALDVVDLVVSLGSATVSDALRVIKPRVLLLGDGHTDTGDPMIRDAIEAQRAIGGQVRYYAGEPRYATAELLRSSAQDLEQTRYLQFHASCRRQNITRSSLRRVVEAMSQSSILVLGDTIVDHYVACEPLGMSSEAPVIVVREIEGREFVGGAAVVAAHGRALGSKVHYVSVVGADKSGSFTQEHLSALGVDAALIVDESRPTTHKTRYMVENQKLLRVSRLLDHEIEGAVEEELIDRITQLAPTVDAVVVSDFVYGVVTPRVLGVIEELQKAYGFITLADLQCSSQVGDVSKFSNMSVLCPTEKEARIALGARSESLEWVASTLMEATSSSRLVLKLGQDGFVTYERDHDGFVMREHFPALSTEPLDLTGAGDSLLATLATALGSGSSFIEASALGALVASMAVKNMGNQPIDVVSLVQAIEKSGIK